MHRHLPGLERGPRLRTALAIALAASLILTLTVGALAPAPAGADHSDPAIVDPGCQANALAANDDGSTGEITLPFSVNYFGVPYDSLFVNNNGNVTFASPLGTFTPFVLTADTPPIIAPFFADVDTRGPGSSLVTYGAIPDSPTFGGRDVFCVNWRDVGYFPSQDDKLNDFQLLLVERGDAAPGDFDIYFNYERILWETGSASGGTNGFGGNSAGAGYAGGTGLPSSFFELPCSRVNGACLDTNGATGLHNTSTNSTVAGRHIFSIRGGGETFTGSISGTVTDGTSGIEGAFVQVCRQDAGFCASTGFTGSDGGYQATNLPPGTYNVSVSPPGNLSPETAVGELADGESLIIDFVLELPQPPPEGTSIDDDTPPGQIPSVVVGRPLTLRTTGCEGGTATFVIDGERGMLSGSMIEGPPGNYTAEFSLAFTGPAEVQITITCPDSSVEETDFNIYIDPSGFVRTTEGDPIVGATVTLYRSDTEAGPFTVVPDGSVLMSPSNRTNPDVTDNTGHFGWDVVAGFYFVRAEAEGCVSPDDASQAFVDTEVLTIPPPVTDLDIRLACGVTRPPEGSITIDDASRTNGSLARLTGSLTCDAGDRYRLTVVLTQGESVGEGRTTGSCTGSSQTFRIVATLSSGPGFTSGPAQACAVATSGTPGSRVVNGTEELCAGIFLNRPIVGRDPWWSPGADVTGQRRGRPARSRARKRVTASMMREKDTTSPAAFKPTRANITPRRVIGAAANTTPRPSTPPKALAPVSPSMRRSPRSAGARARAAPATTATPANDSGPPVATARTAKATPPTFRARPGARSKRLAALAARATTRASTASSANPPPETGAHTATANAPPPTSLRPPVVRRPRASARRWLRKPRPSAPVPARSSTRPRRARPATVASTRLPGPTRPAASHPAASATATAPATTRTATTTTRPAAVGRVVPRWFSRAKTGPASSARRLRHPHHPATSPSVRATSTVTGLSSPRCAGRASPPWKRRPGRASGAGPGPKASPSRGWWPARPGPTRSGGP